MRKVNFRLPIFSLSYFQSQTDGFETIFGSALIVVT